MKLLHNAKIYTLDKDFPVVSSLLIDNHRILAVEEKGALQLSQSQSWQDLAQEKIDLEGRTVIPGLIDAHLNFCNPSA